MNVGRSARGRHEVAHQADFSPREIVEKRAAGRRCQHGLEGCCPVVGLEHHRTDSRQEAARGFLWRILSGCLSAGEPARPHLVVSRGRVEVGKKFLGAAALVVVEGRRQRRRGAGISKRVQNG